jgi:hypothetical protein
MSTGKAFREPKAKQEQCITLIRPKIKKTVMKMAKKCHIKLRQKGHSQQNFHFSLNHPKAGKFMRKIASLGVIEDFKVPRWLERTIRMNLEESANSVFGGSRAKKAKQLLAEFDKRSHDRGNLVKVKPQANSALHNATPAFAAFSKVKAKLRQCLNIAGAKINNVAQSIRRWHRTAKLAYAR